ncbi:DNA double-strand break repair helicase HerA [Candidatus Gugararchaeum adminiculabundum]|nr:DNA double-strand break repair helicase HerA [Candidatus Gugararchaeum adminiculabundum]
MANSELGTVISTFEGPTTANFAFVISNTKVRKGQFVQTQTEDGLLIGMVLEITRANRYFERAESVAEYEKNSSMVASFPTQDWEYVIANTKALGLFKDRNLIRSTFPAAPGAKVHETDIDMLREFLGFVENGLNIGKLQNHDVEVKLPLNNLFQKHLAMLAMSGAGKSYLASVILEELLDRKPEYGRLSVVVVDVHGEYLGFKQGAYADRTSVFDGRKIRVGLHKVSPQMLCEFLPELNSVQRREISKIMGELRAERKEMGTAYGMPDLIARIEQADMNKAVKSSLVGWLLELDTYKLFGKGDYPIMDELCRPGRLSVLDLSDLDSQKKKQLIVAYFAKKLFRQRKKGKIPPFALLVEEAHNFCREKAKASMSISKPIIETIAREGRKFGASLILVSQRPVQLSTTALSQCNTNIFLRVTNPYDIKHIAESCEGIDFSMQNSITSLRVGEALIVGEAVSHPIFVKVRKRKSVKSSKGESLETLAKKFEEMEVKKKEDVEAFI